MSASVLISETDGSFRIEQIDGKLETMQKLVGGYIEAVTGDNWHIYCNEEGKLKGLSINNLSTVFITELISGFNKHDVLVGTILWLGNSPSGNETSLPLSVMKRFVDTALAVTRDPITVIRWKNDIWVYDVPDAGPAGRIRGLAALARAADDHGTIEVVTGLTPGRWTEVRVELMDHPEITLHDERDDKSYG